MCRHELETAPTSAAPSPMTAGGLLVRAQTLNKDQDRPSGLMTSGEPTHYDKQ